MSPPAGRNPIRRIGRASGRGYTMVPNELIRHGVPEFGASGTNAFAVLVLLLSHSEGYPTSAVDMSRQLGWGKNRRRCTAALAALQKAGRLVIRDHVYEDGHRVRQEYVIRADGDRFSDAEREEWSRPLVLSRRGRAKTLAGDSE